MNFTISRPRKLGRDTFKKLNLTHKKIIYVGNDRLFLCLGCGAVVKNEWTIGGSRELKHLYESERFKFLLADEQQALREYIDKVKQFKQKGLIEKIKISFWLILN